MKTENCFGCLWEGKRVVRDIDRLVLWTWLGRLLWKWKTRGSSLRKARALSRCFMIASRGKPRRSLENYAKSIAKRFQRRSKSFKECPELHQTTSTCFNLEITRYPQSPFLEPSTYLHLFQYCFSNHQSQSHHFSLLKPLTPFLSQPKPPPISLERLTKLIAAFFPVNLVPLLAADLTFGF